VWYRHAAALGAVGNVLMMMGANLVGFVIGTEGSSSSLANCSELYKVSHFLLPSIISESGCAGLKFLVMAVACLFVGAQIMFEYRCVIFLYSSDHTEPTASGRKKCDKACIGAAKENI